MTFSITNDQAVWLSRATKAIERIADEFYPRLKKAWDSRTTQSPKDLAKENRELFAELNNRFCENFRIVAADVKYDRFSPQITYIMNIDGEEHRVTPKFCGDESIYVAYKHIQDQFDRIMGLMGVLKRNLYNREEQEVRCHFDEWLTAGVGVKFDKSVVSNLAQFNIKALIQKANAEIKASIDPTLISLTASLFDKVSPANLALVDANKEALFLAKADGAAGLADCIQKRLDGIPDIGPELRSILEGRSLRYLTAVAPSLLNVFQAKDIAPVVSVAEEDDDDYLGASAAYPAVKRIDVEKGRYIDALRAMDACAQKTGELPAACVLQSAMQCTDAADCLVAAVSLGQENRRRYSPTSISEALLSENLVNRFIKGDNTKHSKIREILRARIESERLAGSGYIESKKLTMANSAIFLFQGGAAKWIVAEIKICLENGKPVLAVEAPADCPIALSSQEKKNLKAMVAEAQDRLSRKPISLLKINPTLDGLNTYLSTPQGARRGRKCDHGEPVLTQSLARSVVRIALQTGSVELFGIGLRALAETDRVAWLEKQGVFTLIDGKAGKFTEAIASEINNVPASWAAAALERNDERAFLALMNRVTAIDSSVLQRMKTSVETYGITSPRVIAAIEYVELGMIAFSDGNQSSREVTPLKRRAIF